MWLLRTLLFVALLVVFIVLAVQNHDEQGVTVKLFGWTLLGVPIWMVMFASILVGFVIGLLVSLAREVRLRFDQGKLRRERDELSREIGRLRAAPLHDLDADVGGRVEPPL